MRRPRPSGTLKSTPQQTVETKTTTGGDQAIVIEPANPQVVYVPAVQPAGRLHAATHRPVVIKEEDNSAEAAAAGAIVGFAAGIAIGAAMDNDYYYGPYGWHGGGYMYNDAWDDFYDDREDAREDFYDHREDSAAQPVHQRPAPLHQMVGQGYQGVERTKDIDVVIDVGFADGKLDGPTKQPVERFRMPENESCVGPLIRPQSPDGPIPEAHCELGVSQPRNSSSKKPMADRMLRELFISPAYLHPAVD